MSSIRVTHSVEFRVESDKAHATTASLENLTREFLVKDLAVLNPTIKMDTRLERSYP